MERDPLLGIPEPSPVLSPLPEDGEITIPLTPSSCELKDRLIFGSASASASSSSSLFGDSAAPTFLEALAAFTLKPPRSSIQVPDCEDFSFDQKPSVVDSENQPSWLFDPNIPAFKTNLHRSRTAPAMATINEIDHQEAKPPQFVWLLVSTLAVARAFLYLAEARVDKRHRMMAKWVLGQDMTVAQFLAADIDNNGFVSKSEFVIYKLKEMGKISEKDILLICKQFEKLDAGNCGKITLADLMESHH